MGTRGPAPGGETLLSFTPGVPEAPDRLSEEARKEYDRVVAICKDSGQELQQVDAAILEVYAQSWADYWRVDGQIVLTKEIIQLSNGAYQKNPLCVLREDAWKRLLAAAARLGFSPTDRKRVAKAGRGKADPLAGFG